MLTAVTLTACSSGGEPTSASTEQPTVGVQTTCDRLFVQGDPRLWSRATTLVAKESNGETVDSGEVEYVAEQLTKVAESSEESIRPHVEQMHATVANLDSLDTGDYKLAATEVANQCAEYVAVN